MNAFRSRGGRLLAAFLIGGSALISATFASAKSTPANNKNKVQALAPVVPTTYSGRATAVNIQGVEEPVVGAIVLADTGDLPNAGGFLEASESNYTLFGTDGVTVALGFNFAESTAAGDGAAANADSALSGFQVRFASHHGEHAGEIVTITADYISASASASIAPNGNANALASSSFSNLRVDGIPVEVTGEPNQTIEVPDGRIVFNEQTTIITGGQADIRLVPMRVYMCDCMDGSFGMVYAGITAGSTPPSGHDCNKLTGVGWIAGPSGAKASFGVSGGIRSGEFWGHLTFIDQGGGLKVKSTGVIGFAPKAGDPDCRIITYNVDINGFPGTAVVEACDHGEPGRNDRISIHLSTGYIASGTLGSDGPGGGNLQLHKCPPGWDK